MQTMQAAILVAKISALIYLSVSVGLFFSPKYYQEKMVKMLDDPGAMYLGAFMALVFGMLILQVHNVWEKNWTVLVTLMGWLALMKGIWLFAFPSTIEWFKPMVKGKHLSKLAGVTLVLGLVFGYFGFFVG